MIGGTRFIKELLFLHLLGSCYLVMLSEVMYLYLYSSLGGKGVLVFISFYRYPSGLCLIVIPTD